MNRCAWPPVDSIVKMSNPPSEPCESKANRWPSGDQVALPWFRPGPWVSWVGLVPSALATRMSVVSPLRFEVNETSRTGRGGRRTRGAWQDQADYTPTQLRWMADTTGATCSKADRETALEAVWRRAHCFAPCAPPCRCLPAFGVVKGQENGNVAVGPKSQRERAL